MENFVDEQFIGDKSRNFEQVMRLLNNKVLYKLSTGSTISKLPTFFIYVLTTEANFSEFTESIKIWKLLF